ncbi:uncharacterized protein GGS25DRAFT_387604 [Hypoxylon fragiforme]|uniref:uncharacterized protein n=1 Tax=Hypoxylon fragiforme TaxID=63214 RepID=UPI0020C60D9D|nr:uncharacterized protein GGS25DRAFT_387604 [Hypoxylon fragiforme]KAI2606377.1 hypothetical protein GGS25DRAFT_387604 [Hypoxylon fragiforme]
MKFSSLPGITVLVLYASCTIGIPLQVNASSTAEDTVCSIQSFKECIADTGRDNSLCFKQMCVGANGAELRLAKRQDTCTEENLLQCAVTEWREAEICFQELCL